jgi:TPR repeat protein
MYARGDGSLDESMAVEMAFNYFTAAAKQNHPRALNNLGNMYFSGSMGEKNYEFAFLYFKKVSLSCPSTPCVGVTFPNAVSFFFYNTGSRS